jgi:hypothetical protein
MARVNGSDHTGKDGKVVAFTNVPRMQLIKPDELRPWSLPVLVDGGRFTIGWQHWPDEKGGPGFVTYQRTRLASLKIVERYPLTPEGWRKAWQSLMDLDSENAERVRRVLAQRAEADSRSSELEEDRIELEELRRELEESALARLARVVFLGGYMPGADLEARLEYDLLFLKDRMGIFEPANLRSVGEVPYIGVADMQVGGPGLVRSVDPLAGVAEDIAGAAVRIARPSLNANLLAAVDKMISATVNAAGTRTKIKTVLFVQATDAELFFLHTRTEPEQLRIELSPALGRIRETLSASQISRQSRPVSGDVSVVDELSRAATLLDRGLLTRDEFDQLKNRLIKGS